MARLRSDSAQPTAKRGGRTQLAELLHSGQKDVLHQVFGIARRNARQQDRMDHARITDVKLPERRAVARSRGTDKSVVVDGFVRRQHC